MQTFHIHIEGVVQGVGFRPFVYQTAMKHHIKGWVNNTNDGVHIECTDTEEKVQNFYNYLLNNLPPLAQVTNASMVEKDFISFEQFDIVESTNSSKPKLLVTPDVALCKDCRSELYDTDDRRFQYAFITCTNCGPRYSIINALPYDRPHTTMADFKMCKVCLDEYNNPLERRHYSQTNSCPDCRIEMQLYHNGEITENFEDLDKIVEAWKTGKIIAIKGIGGYLLTCDATNAKAIETLRQRKKRPKKPFALMYPSIQKLKMDTIISEKEEKQLLSNEAPIVLLSVKENSKSNIAFEAINKGLSRIGVMLPYTPLMDLLVRKFGKPIVATSGNISQSTIIYEDDKAIEHLSNIADILLMNNRDIMLPQDDGVVQFSPKHQVKIVLRRSRGQAPIYINSKLNLGNTSVFATGGMLKSVFAFVHENNIYVSQYMGNTESYDAQVNYKHTYKHLTDMLQTEFDHIVTDKHPDYFATRFGQQIAKEKNASTSNVQHHKAHFWSVMGEHLLMDQDEPVLGFIWDGTGLGDDGNIWGGECFVYKHGEISRINHIDEFPFILGDKMPLEPRISAFAVMQHLPEYEPFIKDKFSATEWHVYKQLISQTNLSCTSMGRLFDAVASLLFGYDIHSYEAEASMKLEHQALSIYHNLTDKQIDYDTWSYVGESLENSLIKAILKGIYQDLIQNIDRKEIAFKFHVTLAHYIKLMGGQNNIKNIAFSGGVFQNSLLVDLINDFMHQDFKLFFHKDFSPNDEGIAFGQLVASHYIVENS